jgi:hypothetical protein
LVIPWTAAKIPSLAQSPVLAQPSSKPGTGVYFSKVVHRDAADLASPYIAAATRTNRFNFEAWLLNQAGVDIVALSPTQRFTLQFFFDGLFPFAVLIVVSQLTRPTDPTRVALFYGKMKTPVGATPELEDAAMEATRLNPARFDHTKLLPRSNWEFCRWDRTDSIGFLACCSLSAAIVGLFLFLLHLGSGG